MFQNNVWNRTLTNLVVFDDVFIDQNIHSGLAVAPGHRQNLHELILGAQAVALNRQLQQLIAQIEQHNAALREKAAAIPATERGTLSLDDFCALPPNPEIDAAIETTERNLAAAREREPIRNAQSFDTFSLPAFDTAAINRILEEGLPSLDAAAASRVQAHLAGLGRGGEAWVNEGMRFMSQSTRQTERNPCPFCAQDLNASTVINHYREYFSAAYSSLKQRISAALEETNQTHGNDRPAAFERAIRVAVERRQFWSRFGDIPEISVDTAAIVRDWRMARETVAAALTAKQASPLERMSLAEDARTLITRYEGHQTAIATLSGTLRQTNEAIRVIKEQAATGNLTALNADLSRLKAVKARHTSSNTALCNTYLAEKAAKTATEQQRDQTRTALDDLRNTVFAG
jgi:wobble nucleotide-excising tRNase